MATKSDLVSSSTTSMTLIKFIGGSYIYWARSVEMFLRGKGLSDHLISDKSKSGDSSSPWDQEDNQIMSLMLNSIEPNIGAPLLDLRYAKAIS